MIGVDAGAPAAAEALRGAGVELHLDDRRRRAARARRARSSRARACRAQAPVIAAARARGMPVLGELELAWRLLPNEFIAVTGTNGKTTTVELIGHIHRAAGLPVAVAGNVGTALSVARRRRSSRDATVVCEASSFQLEDTLAFAPEAAVLLNLTPDHLDRHGTLEAYRDGQAAGVRPPGRRATSRCAPRRARARATSARRARVRFGAAPRRRLRCATARCGGTASRCCARDELRLRGRHNLENAMAAAAVCLARGRRPRTPCARRCARSPASPHRLEEVATRRRRALRQRLQGHERRQHARRAARRSPGAAST